MPSLLLNLHSLRYDDGDILVAVNKKRAEYTHAQHECHTKLVKRDRWEMRPRGCLPERMAVRRSKYRFTRINKTTLLRTTIMTGEMLEIGSTPVPDPDQNGLLVHSHVEELISRIKVRMHDPRCGEWPLFGEPGAEVLYQKSRPMTRAALDSLWARITAVRPEKRIEDHGEWDYSTWHFNKQGEWVSGELERFLVVPIEDATDARVRALVEPDIDNTDPDNPIQIKQRKHKVDWRALSLASEADILDREKTIDVRSRTPLVDTDIVIMKGR